MLGRDALTGYRNIYDNRSRPLYQTDNQSFTESIFRDPISVERVLNWIELFKKMEFKMTADVVAIYLIATDQLALLGSEVGYSRGGNDVWVYDNQRLKSGFGHLKRPPSYESHRDDAVQLTFPSELYRMAQRYLFNRSSEFVRLLVSTHCDHGKRALKVGMHVPINIINALNSMTIIGESLNSVIENVKGLYATMMPTCVDRSGSEHDRLTKYPSLKWNRPAATGLHCPKSEPNTRERIGVQVVREFASLVDMMNTLGEVLIDALAKGVVDGTTMPTKEAFCKAAEMLVYIMSASNSGFGSVALHIPEVDDINKYYLANQLTESGDVRTQKTDIDTRWTLIAQRFSHLSPDAALCVADILGAAVDSHHNVLSTCYLRWERTLELIAKLNPNPCGEVVSFLIDETTFQHMQVCYIKSALQELDAQKEGV